MTYSDSFMTDVFQQTVTSPCVIGDPSIGCKFSPVGWAPSVGYSGSGAPYPEYTAESGPGTQTLTNAGLTGSNTSGYDFFSPLYLASGNAAVADNGLGTNLPTIPVSFTIGVDENLAGGHSPEILVAFRVWQCNGTGQTNYSGTSGTVAPAATGCTIDTANSYQPSSALHTDPNGGPNQPYAAIPDEHNGTGFSDFILTGFNLSANKRYYFEAIVANDTDGMEQFFIVPSGTPIPEPGSILLFGSTLLGIGIVARRRWSLGRKS